MIDIVFLFLNIEQRLPYLRGVHIEWRSVYELHLIKRERNEAQTVGLAHSYIVE